jgi:hypothetical protein
MLEKAGQTKHRALGRCGSAGGVEAHKRSAEVGVFSEVGDKQGHETVRRERRRGRLGTPETAHLHPAWKR